MGTAKHGQRFEMLSVKVIMRKNQQFYIEYFGRNKWGEGQMNRNNFIQWVILVISIVVLLLAISLAFVRVNMQEKPKSKIPPNPVLISSKARIGSYVKVWWSLEPYGRGWVNVTHRDLISYPVIDFEIYNSGGDGNVVVHVRIDYWGYNATKHNTFFVKSNSTLTGSIEFKEIWTSPYESPDAIRYWIKVEPES